VKIYILLVLLFLTINQSIAQPVRIAKSKATSINATSKKDPPLSLTLTALLEAMYVTGGTAMIMAPDVTVELHDGSTLALVESKTGTLSTAGVGSFQFITASNGTPYYIVVKSLNTLETWSTVPVRFTDGTLTYDFTTNLDKAFTDESNPSLALHRGKYCLYSGDVNQDGFVTSNDYTGIDNDASQGDYHLVNDLNGDGFVTSNDYTFVDNNSSAGLMKQVPIVAPPTSLVYEGQTYHIVQIGTQYWLRENLNVGTRIDGGLDQTGIGPDHINKYCYMDNDDNCNIYGGLYQWNEAMQFSTTEKAQGICPPDWHIPTLNEFNSLISTVNGDNLALIEIGQGNGTNTSGFSALTEPYFGYYDSNIWWWGDQDNSSNFWSSTSTIIEDNSVSYEMYFYNAESSINMTPIERGYGFAVRCVKN
jgi:uncharacterized protein (TIGR02145 family)